MRAKVADRGDRGPEAAPERLGGGGAAQILVAARANRFGDDLQLAVFGLKLEHRLGADRGLVDH